MEPKVVDTGCDFGYVSADDAPKVTPTLQLSDINLSATILDPFDIDELKSTYPSSEEDNYSDKLFKFKQTITNRRKATFCCIFSGSTLILSIILFLAPLCSKMSADFKLYHVSTHTRCDLISVSLTNHTMDTHNVSSTNNNTLNTSLDCYYIYENTALTSLSAHCGGRMHEVASCGYQLQEAYVNNAECYIWDDMRCRGTVVNVPALKRSENMFVFLLCVASAFGAITLCSCIYGIYLAQKSGVYYSIHAIKHDDDNMLRLMQKSKNNKRKRHKKKHKGRKKKRHQLYEFEPTDDDFSSIFSSQFGVGSIASTIPSKENDIT